MFTGKLVFPREEYLMMKLKSAAVAAAALVASVGVTMGVRPEHVLFGELAKKAPFKADVTVEVVEPMGADTLVWSELDGISFRFRVEGQLQLATGDVVPIGFDPARGSLFDAEDLRI